MTNSRYSAFPDHPMKRVPQECLDVARRVLEGGALTKDVEAQANAIADAIVMRLGQTGWLRAMPCNEPVPGRHCPTCGHHSRHHFRGLCVQCRLDLTRARAARLELELNGEPQA